MKWMILMDGKPAIYRDGFLWFARTHYRGAGLEPRDLFDSSQEAERVIARTSKARRDNKWNDDFAYWRIPIRLGE